MDTTITICYYELSLFTNTIHFQQKGVIGPCPDTMR